MSQRLTAGSALALLGGDWAPEFVDHADRVAADLVDVAFEMGGPQSQSGVARERRVARDDVDLAVDAPARSIARWLLDSAARR